jgi:hypothetical protein
MAPVPVRVRELAPGPSGWRRPAVAWAALLLGIAVGVAAVECGLLELYKHFFSGRFPAVNVLPSLGAFAVFFAAAVALNAAFTLALWVLAAPLLRRLRLGPVQTFAGALLLGAGLPLAVDAARYPLRSYLGAAIDLELFLDLAGGHLRDLVSLAGEHLAPLSALLAGALMAAVVVVASLRRVDAGVRALAPFLVPPRLASLAFSALGFLIVAGGVLASVCGRERPLCHGLGETVSGIVLSQVVAVATDVDRDGYGLLVWPRDAAPFDASIHPYATDTPGNGIDENGIGGDHPPDVAWTEPVSDAPPRWTRRPHFLLVFLESFREDLLDAEYAGRRVTPTLAALAQEGGRSSHAYANSPFTVRSRGQLLGGRLWPYAGQSTLLDDFRANGYRLAWFSGQDDSFGDSAPILGYEQVDHFYDARDDVARRYTDSATKASLGVSWKVLNERILPYLAAADPAQPLFLYVNYYDTHYPYHHREVDDLLGISPVSRGEIVPENREHVFQTYMNTAANVDRALGDLLVAWRRFAGDGEWAVVVVSDHAQAFFDHGHLGHGQSLRPEQSRVPLVVRGIGGDWPEPLGIAELRGIVQRNLSEPGASGRPPLPRFVSERERAVFQYLGGLGRPRIVGVQRLDDALFYGFGSARLDHIDHAGADLPAADAALFDALIWRWESIAIVERAAGRVLP